MKEYPVFLPYRDEHLAAVLTVPPSDPSGLVMLLSGTGAPRSHRFQLWTRVARDLATVGLASIRMDYRGTGDSTGRLLQPVLGDRRLEQATVVARFGMQVLSLDRLAVVGNCSGAIVALGLAAQMPECERAFCIMPRLVEPRGVSRAAMEVRKTGLAAVARRSALLRRLVTRTLRGRRDTPSDAVRMSFGPALDHARVLFIYSDADQDPYVERSRRLLDRMAAQLSPERREHLEIETIRDGPLHGFESLPVQARVKERILRWVPQAFLQDVSGLERSASHEPGVPV
jgi:pimeloyl-ACP methyl ester carboxylesterase